MDIEKMRKLANTLRIRIIEMITEAGTGHPGGSLSMVDLLTVLYFEKMNLRPDDPHWPERDRFVLSKGHGAAGWYAVLAERGFFPTETLKTYRKFHSILQGHPDMKATPGVDMTSGSLGQGLSAANGMALSAKLDGKRYQVYALVGDGELQEGQLWEAAMTAAHYKLDQITLLVDYNRLQINGPSDQVMQVQPLADKFTAFGWHVLEIDGHNLREISETIDKAKLIRGKPTVIIANTVKGKGVSFMENKVEWHGSAPNLEQKKLALAELEGSCFL